MRERILLVLLMVLVVGCQSNQSKLAEDKEDCATKYQECLEFQEKIETEYNETLPEDMCTELDTICHIIAESYFLAKLGY